MSKNTRYKWILVKVLVVVSFITMIATNMAAVILPLNNISIKEVSQLYPNLFTPASFTFSIWSIIYLALAGFVVYQINPTQKEKGILSTSLLLKLRFAFIISCVLNISWIFSWHYLKLGLSVLIMLFLLVNLIYINRLTRSNTPNPKENLFVRIPFSLYFGWISVATIANITAFLVGSNWDRFGLLPETWTIIMLVIGILIASAVVIGNKDNIYPLVILWAYGGILSRHLSSAGFGGHYYAIMITTVTCMVFILVFTAVRSIYHK